MKIRKDSWHYRWYTLLGREDRAEKYNPGTCKDEIHLCPYMRKMIIETLMIIGGACLLIFGAYVLLSAAVASIMSFVLYLVTDNPFIWVGEGVEGIVGTVMIVIVALASAWVWVTTKIKAVIYKRKEAAHVAAHVAYMANIETPNIVPKQPSIIWLYIKSLHDKVCPILEIEDTDARTSN